MGGSFAHRRDCQDFRVGVGAMGKKSHYIATQSTCDSITFTGSTFWSAAMTAAALQQRGLLASREKALAERALDAEMDHTFS